MLAPAFSACNMTKPGLTVLVCAAHARVSMPYSRETFASALFTELMCRHGMLVRSLVVMSPCLA